jgi:hypothetical protein
VRLSWGHQKLVGQKTYLTHDIKVIESSHIGVGPSMNGDVMISLEGGHKLIWIPDDLATDHKMSCCIIIGLQKLHKGGGGLNVDDDKLSIRQKKKKQRNNLLEWDRHQKR